MWTLATNSMLVSIVALAAICSFWPYLAGYQNMFLENTVLRDSLNAQSNRETSLVAIALLVPMIFDWLVEVGDGSSEDHNIKPLLNPYEKLILLVGLLVVPCCVVFMSNDYDGLGLLWLCMSRFQIVTVLGIFPVAFSRIDNGMLPWWMSLLFITILTIAVNLTSWESLNENLDLEGPITTATMALKIIVLMISIVSSGRILIELGLLFYYLRSTKWINAHHLQTLVESRKQYLRYIAHEIRLVYDFMVF